MNIFFVALASFYVIAFFLLTHKSLDNTRAVLFSFLFGIVHSYGFSRVLGVIALMIFWGVFGSATDGHLSSATMPILVAVGVAVLAGLEMLWIMLCLTFSKVAIEVKFAVIIRYAVVLALCDAAVGAAWYPAAEYLESHPKLRAAVGMNFQSQHVGFIDQSGKLVLPAKYIVAGDFKDGLAMVVEPTSANPVETEETLTLERIGDARTLRKCSFIDKTGRKIIDSVETTSDHFSDGSIPFYDRKKSLFGFIDRKGQISLPPLYREANGFEDGLATVKIDDQTNKTWACIDKSGKILWTIKLADEMSGFAGGIARVLPASGSPDKHYFVDRSGKRMSNEALLHTNVQLFECAADGLVGEPAIMDSIQVSPGRLALPYSEGLSLTKSVAHGDELNAQWKFLDTELKSPFAVNLFSDARSFKEGKSAVKESDGRWMFIDKQGNALSKERFRSANSFSDGMASFSVYTTVDRQGDPGEPRYGFIDSSGQIKVEPKFVYVRSFSDGLAAVQID